MTREQEQTLKAAAEQTQCGQTNPTPHGAISGLMACRTSLRDRIRGQRERAQIEGHRADQLGELEYLLDKHPDVARILELMEAVRG